MKKIANNRALCALIVCLAAPLASCNTTSTTAVSVTVPVAPADETANLGSSVTVDVPPATRSTAPKSLKALVEAQASITPKSYSADCLARAVYFESRDQALEGQLAVAEVVLNRTKDPRWSNNVCDVVREKAQFSFVQNGVIPNPNAASKAWKKAVAIAHIAMNHLAHSRASTALFYHADYVSPTWRHQLKKQAVLGAHIFYS